MDDLIGYQLDTLERNFAARLLTEKEYGEAVEDVLRQGVGYD